MDSSGKGNNSVSWINYENVSFDNGSKEEVQQHFRVPVCPSSHSPKDSKHERVSGFSPTWYLTKIPIRVMLFELKGGQLGIDLKWMSMHEFPIHKLHLPDYVLITLRGCFTLPPYPNINLTAVQGNLLRKEGDTPGSISAILKTLKYRRTESQALTWEEALNKHCSLNWDYSNRSCMLPKKGTTSWGFIQRGINQGIMITVHRNLCSGNFKLSHLRSWQPEEQHREVIAAVSALMLLWLSLYSIELLELATTIELVRLSLLGEIFWSGCSHP